MERVRRAVAVELKCPPPELSTVEEPHRRIVEEIAAHVAVRGRLEKEKYGELYRRFRKQYPLSSQLIQQAMNQGVETGKSFLKLKRNGRVHKPPPRGSTRLHPLCQRQLELPKDGGFNHPSQNRRIPPRREEGGLD